MGLRAVRKGVGRWNSSSPSTPSSSSSGRRVLRPGGPRLPFPSYPFHPGLRRWGPGNAGPSGWGARCGQGRGSVAVLAILIPAGRTGELHSLVLVLNTGGGGREAAFACYASPVRELAEAARWSGAFLLEGRGGWSSALSPAFLVLSDGIRKSLTYPLKSRSHAVLRDGGRPAGIATSFYDRMTALGSQLPSSRVLEARPERFCSLTDWGRPARGGDGAAGILPDGGRGDRGADRGGGCHHHPPVRPGTSQPATPGRRSPTAPRWSRCWIGPEQAPVGQGQKHAPARCTTRTGPPAAPRVSRQSTQERDWSGGPPGAAGTPEIPP